MFLVEPRGGTIVEPEGPPWLLDLGEGVGQVTQETNPQL